MFQVNPLLDKPNFLRKIKIKIKMSSAASFGLPLKRINILQMFFIVLLRQMASLI